MRWVEGDISHYSWVLCPEQSACSGKFGCHSFIKHTLEHAVCFLVVTWKNFFLWLHFLSLPTQEVWPDYVVYFSLHFFRALAASCVLYDRIEHSQGFSIFLEFLAFWLAEWSQIMSFSLSSELITKLRQIWLIKSSAKPREKFLCAKNFCYRHSTWP